MEANSLDRLPRAYRIGLQLRALGADDALIADCLDIPVGGIETLLSIGTQKLRHLGPGDRSTQSSQERMTRMDSNTKELQSTWDAAAAGDYGPALDSLADDVQIENGPGAGPWHKAHGKDDVALMLLEFIATFGDTFHQDGRVVYADEHVTISLVKETGGLPNGAVFDNLAVWVSRRGPDGRTDRIWTTDLNSEKCEAFWGSHPTTPSKDFS